MRLGPILILLAMVAGSGLAQKQPSGPPFALTVSAESTANLASGVWVKIRWTNTSEKALDASANILDATNVDPNFLFELHDNASRPVPRRVYRFPETSGHAEFGTLNAGESITHEVDLVRLFELKKPGKYTLQISRSIPKALGDGTVKSNKITIAITE